MIKIKNKKAQIGESLQDIVGVIIIALLLIIFFALSGVLLKGSVDEIQKVSAEQSTINQEHLSLNSWLQKSITIVKENNEQNMTVTELIILSKRDSVYKTILDEEAKNTFGENYKLRIMTQEDVVKIGWQPMFIGGTLTIMPYVKETGSLFYIPSNETIVVALQKIK